MREGKAFPETGLHIPVFDLLSIFAGHLGGQCALYRHRSGQRRAVVDRILKPNESVSVWFGPGAQHTENDRNRSVKLEAFLQLLRLTDFDFYRFKSAITCRHRRGGPFVRLNRFIAAAHGFLRNGGRSLTNRPIDIRRYGGRTRRRYAGSAGLGPNSPPRRIGDGASRATRRRGIKAQTLATARAPRLGKRYRTAVGCAGATGKEKRAPEKLVQRRSKICRLQLKTKAPPIRKYRRLYRGV